MLQLSWRTWTGLRWQGKDKGGWTFTAGDCTTQWLRLKAAQLLHKVRTLHECDVSEVEVAEDVVFETASAFLIGTGQVEATRVTPEALLVVVVVVVQSWWFWNKKGYTKLYIISYMLLYCCYRTLHISILRCLKY